MKKSLFLVGLVLVVSFQLLFSEWSTNPAVNNPVCNATDFQNKVKICKDGTNGAITVWEDFRSGTNYDIFAQRIDATGYVKWTTDGISICNDLAAQNSPYVADDNSGGAYFVWADDRNWYGDGYYTDVYAQRVNSSGVVQWTANGIGVCTGQFILDLPKVMADGSGNGIVSWCDVRNTGYEFDIYMQKINTSGVPQWTSNGIPVSIPTGNQYYQEMISDGAGGVIIVWQDERNGFSNPDVYAQRIDSSGTIKWTLNGVPVCADLSAQHYPKLVGDGSGGAIICWDDERNGNFDVYAQRINSSGVVQWTTNGVPVTSLSYWQVDPAIMSLNSGGAVIAWRDTRSGIDEDVYIQKINSSGVSQWTANGVLVCSASGDQHYPILVNDGNDNALLFWNDRRNPNNDIYAQLFNSSGVPQWQTNGLPVNTTTNMQEFCGVVVSDDASGAIIAWEDIRNGWINDIYAQRVFSNGTLSPALPNEVIINEFDADVTNEWVELLVIKTGGIDLRNWILSDEDPVNMSTPTEGNIIFANNSSLSNIPKGTYLVVVNGSGTDDTNYSDKNMTLYTGNSLLSVTGTFDLNNSGDNITLWYDDNGTWDSVNSIGIDHISYKISISPPAGVTWSGPISGTRDSSGNEAYFSDGSNYNNDSSTNWTASQSHTQGSGNPGQDDPPTPVVLSSFTAVVLSGNNIQLQWMTQSETNNSGWNIYRGENEDALLNDECLQINPILIPGSGTISQPSDYSYTDEYPVIPNNEYWYWLESLDYSGSVNSYGPISLMIPDEEENPENPENYENYGLHQNFPNPFNSLTTISFLTAEDKENAEIEIYNVKGEKIRTLDCFNHVETKATRSLYSRIWDGKDKFGKPVSSGIYYYKLITGEDTFLKKMIKLR